MSMGVQMRHAPGAQGMIRLTRQPGMTASLLFVMLSPTPQQPGPSRAMKATLQHLPSEAITGLSHQDHQVDASQCHPMNVSYD